MAQMPLYARATPPTWVDHLSYCVPAAMVDGGGIALIYAVGTLLFRNHAWVCRPGGRGWVLTLGLGLFGAFLTERLALALGWWQYGSQMPTVPYLDVGVSPLLQFLLLPPAALFLVMCRWLRRS
jgi:hypothetical protein